MLATPAWCALTPAARAVYIVLAARFNGFNNGSIGLSARDAARLCNINKDTATRAFRQLIDCGFIEAVTPGGFGRKVRHATEWRLTQYRCDLSGALPSKGFARWRPPIQNAVPKQGPSGPKPGTLDTLVREMMARRVLDLGP
jgi:hypothetical protein